MSDVLMRVTAVDYETEEHGSREYPLVQVTGRDENNERRTLHVSNIDPYLYVPNRLLSLTHSVTR